MDHPTNSTNLEFGASPGFKASPQERTDMESVLDDIRSTARFEIHGEPTLHRFLLPLLRSGMPVDAALRLVKSVPEEWPHDHREIHYDFRLQRWMRILEPPGLEESLREHWVHSVSRRQACGHILRSLWRSAFGRGAKT